MAQEQTARKEQERQAQEREAQRQEALEKTRTANEEKRRRIRAAEKKLDVGDDMDIEKYAKQLEEAARGSGINRGTINTIWTDALYLLDEINNPENNARGVLLSLILADYFGAVQGDIDSTIKYLKLAVKHDPDVRRYLDILCGAKQKREQESKELTKERKAAIEKIKQEEKQEGTKRGVLIGASGVAALVVTWWGFSYFFGK